MKRLLFLIGCAFFVVSIVGTGVLVSKRTSANNGNNGACFLINSEGERIILDELCDHDESENLEDNIEFSEQDSLEERLRLVDVNQVIPIEVRKQAYELAQTDPEAGHILARNSICEALGYSSEECPLGTVGVITPDETGDKELQEKVGNQDNFK